jgi:hypothetical protein
MHQDDDDLSSRVLLSEPGGRRPRGRPKLRWEDGVVEDVARLVCRNWKVVALNQEGGMEETLEGGRGPPQAVAPLERESSFHKLLVHPPNTQQTTQDHLSTAVQLFPQAGHGPPCTFIFYCFSLHRIIDMYSTTVLQGNVSSINIAR